MSKLPESWPEKLAKARRNVALHEEELRMAKAHLDYVERMMPKQTGDNNGKGKDQQPPADQASPTTPGH